MHKVAAMVVLSMVGCGTEVTSVDNAILICNGTPCPAGWYCDSSTLECTSPVCRTCQNLAHATTQCIDVCEITCLSGWADCDHVVSNGCEVATTTTANCGACGVVCPVPAHAAAACIGSACGIGACDAGWDDCNGNAADGCETAIVGPPVACGGACGRTCPPLPHATPACTSGTCTVASCTSGWADCDTLAANGCETNLTTSSTSCGACGHTCSLGSVCHGGVCQRKLCGDGVCDVGETKTNCSIDCGCPPPLVDCCGDGVCRTLKLCLTAC